MTGPYVGPRPLPERRLCLPVRAWCRLLGWLCVVVGGSTISEEETK
jgi:hypothetical protein